VRKGGRLVLAAVLAAGAGQASAQEADPEAGFTIAQEFCASCHTIGPDLYFKQEPPSFASIALYRTDRGIRNRILAPHIGMPTLGPILLDGDKLEDLIAYIRSLDPEPLEAQ